MTWERETEHEQKALDARAGPWQIQGTANILTPLLRQVQELEDAFWEIFDARFIDLAEDYSLEILGAIVGEAAADETDEDYRLRIRLKLRAINSKRTNRDFLELLSLIPESTWSVSSSPGWVNITQRTGPVMDSSVLFRMASIASADGVLVRLTSYEDEDTDFFDWPNTELGGEWASEDGTIIGDAWPGVQS